METQLKQHGQQVAPSKAGGSALPMQCLTSLAWHGLSCPNASDAGWWFCSHDFVTKATAERV